MANFQSYQLTQPYYVYIEENAYNVVPGIITLIFDSVPSSNPSDYQMLAENGILPVGQPFGFSTYDNTFSNSGNSVSLTVPITMDTNATMRFFYQDNELPFRVLAAVNPRSLTPAIFTGLSLN